MFNYICTLYKCGLYFIYGIIVFGIILFYYLNDIFIYGLFSSDLKVRPVYGLNHEYSCSALWVTHSVPLCVNTVQQDGFVPAQYFETCLKF